MNSKVQEKDIVGNKKMGNENAMRQENSKRQKNSISKMVMRADSHEIKTNKILTASQKNNLPNNKAISSWNNYDSNPSVHQANMNKYNKYTNNSYIEEEESYEEENSYPHEKSIAQDTIYSHQDEHNNQSNVGRQSNA